VIQTPHLSRSAACEDVSAGRLRHSRMGASPSGGSRRRHSTGPTVGTWNQQPSRSRPAARILARCARPARTDNDRVHDSWPELPEQMRPHSSPPARRSWQSVTGRSCSDPASWRA
jgi:hypothetical protein